MGKARALIDQLARRNLKSNSLLTEKEQVKQAQMLSKMASLRRKSDHPIDDQSRHKIETRLRKIRLKYDTFINKVRRENPEYHSFKKPEPVSIKKVQSFCPPKTAVLEYGISKKRIIMFMITRDNVKVEIFKRKADSTSASLKVLVDRYRSAIFTRAARDTLKKISKPIYNRLIAPFEQSLASIKNLLIVPSRFLAYLPFDALIHNNHYLITKYDIKYVPSMTSFSLIQKPNAGSFSTMLAIGNSSTFSNNINAPVLAGVELEMRYIEQLFHEATIVTGNNLSEKHVRELLKKTYPAVHIATHGIINEQNPSLSGVLVGKRENGDNIKNDGFLRRSEISRLNITSDLVVLSACETGTGPVISGAGMLGLQQAFFTAGVSTVVVSLWNVYDRATARLMKNFYRSLKNYHNTWADTWHTITRWFTGSEVVPFGDAAKAMRQAKLKMLHSAKYNDPVFWAPFIVIGK